MNAFYLSVSCLLLSCCASPDISPVSLSTISLQVSFGLPTFLWPGDVLVKEILRSFHGSMQHYQHHLYQRMELDRDEIEFCVGNHSWQKDLENSTQVPGVKGVKSFSICLASCGVFDAI